MSEVAVIRGEDGEWESGFGETYNTFVVYADDTDIATYQVHEDGALERLWSKGPVAMNTPIAVSSRASALRQCADAWEERDRRTWKEWMGDFERKRR